jgi:hypothetical protein
MPSRAFFRRQGQGAGYVPNDPIVFTDDESDQEPSSPPAREGVAEIDHEVYDGQSAPPVSKPGEARIPKRKLPCQHRHTGNGGLGSHCQTMKKVPRRAAAGMKKYTTDIVRCSCIGKTCTSPCLNQTNLVRRAERREVPKYLCDVGFTKRMSNRLRKHLPESKNLALRICTTCRSGSAGHWLEGLWSFRPSGYLQRDNGYRVYWRAPAQEHGSEPH